MLRELLNQDPLFVFALEIEAASAFEGCNNAFVGIGKVSAGYHLMKKLESGKPSIIVNLGSAGSTEFTKGSVIACNRFIQRDMDVRALGYRKFETPFSGDEPILEYGFSAPELQQGICGTGDFFEMSHVNTEYNVIDMEAFPLALIAKKSDIPFLCLKYISDGADGAAAEDWLVSVHHAAISLRAAVDMLKS
ncbi:5'-methylthioadenosine/S-adenosylhomocysteine nucleosidase family protein [Flavobacterium selenitireducens]|uniref:5'-methylthioadenosine/S-adenosylhomocysteine nucleosidase family protein n=1 Tax=Flavobacterium selenitireducens TaxID=2722704 RepID=UPI00168A9C08|nr:nucleosidase [Flavobacterium selenitireducens]MBD3582879.1 5'-methylthioadenosine/S-adenosylhomocysteine nucleosidase [Flavobacterium selenitireducens]